MNKLLPIVIASLLASIALPASAKSTAQEDRAAINAAYDAIRSKNPAAAISAVDPIIKSFENERQENTTYTCTSGMSDTLISLLGAATIADQGKQKTGKSITAAVSEDICSAYFIKGFALIDLFKRNEALPNLEMAVEMDSDNQHYINELGEWHKVGKDWKQSLDIFTKASETTDLSISMMKDKKQSTKILNQIRCRSYRGIAFNHAEMRNWNEAKSAIDKCLKLIPNDPGSKRELQYIAVQSGKK